MNTIGLFILQFKYFFQVKEDNNKIIVKELNLSSEIIPLSTKGVIVGWNLSLGDEKRENFISYIKIQTVSHEKCSAHFFISPNTDESTYICGEAITANQKTYMVSN